MGNYRTAPPSRIATLPERRTTADQQSGGPDGNRVCAEDGSALGNAAVRAGVWQRHDLLATAARLAAAWRVGPRAPSAAGPSATRRPTRLESGQLGCLQRARAKGGAGTGPNPTDRGKSGTKRHLVVDRRGVPLTIATSG